MAYKMKGFSGFGNSPLKQSEAGEKAIAGLEKKRQRKLRKAEKKVSKAEEKANIGKGWKWEASVAAGHKRKLRKAAKKVRKAERIAEQQAEIKKLDTRRQRARKTGDWDIRNYPL